MGFYLDPLRLPTWRRDLVQDMLSRTDSPRVPKKLYADKPASKLYRYYRFREQDINNTRSLHAGMLSSLSVPRVFTDNHSAYNLYHANTELRFAVEALVMCDMPANAIAEKLGMSPSAVQTYEDCYFDVRSRLGNDLYITGALLGPLLSDKRVAGCPHDTLWKGIGYYFGAEVLQAFWSLNIPTEEIQDKLRDILLERSRRQALSAGFARTPGSYNASEIISDFLSIDKSKRDAVGSGGEGSGDEELDDLLDATLGSIGIQVRPLTAAALRGEVSADDYEAEEDLTFGVQIRPQEEETK